MSVFKSVNVPCPACHKLVEFSAVYSVNADRRPDLRDAIIKQRFQRQACPSCQETFRLDPELHYFDAGRGQWIAAFPAARLGDWAELEQRAGAAFDQSFGPAAGSMAQSIGADLRARVTFGWAGLREKLVADEEGLDDAVLELLKMTVVRSVPNSPLKNSTELRFLGLEKGKLVLAWIRSGNEQLVEVLHLPRKFYDDIASDLPAWHSLHNEISTGLFVDMLRLMVPARTNEAA